MTTHSPSTIIDLVSAELWVPREAILGHSRAAGAVLARFIAVFLIREHTQLGIVAISSLFGFHYANVSRVKRILPDRMSVDKTTAHVVTKLRNTLSSDAPIQIDHRPIITVSIIVDLVANELGIPRKLICSENRTAPVSWARAVATYLVLRYMRHLTLPEVRTVMRAAPYYATESVIARTSIDQKALHQVSNLITAIHSIGFPSTSLHTSPPHSHPSHPRH